MKPAAENIHDPVPDAIVLIGPTGAGKTPLGECLARDGLNGRRCVHLDFGAALRAVDAGTGTGGGLSAAQTDRVRRALREGALLGDEDWPIADALIRAGLRAARMSPRDLVVLNGIPRHPGQARAIAAVVKVTAVVRLTCPAGVAAERIRADSGGDRGVRADDGAAEIARRLARYEANSRPLLEHYRAIPRVDLPVGVETTAGDLRDALAASASLAAVADDR